MVVIEFFVVLLLGAHQGFQVLGLVVVALTRFLVLQIQGLELGQLSQVFVLGLHTLSEGPADRVLGVVQDVLH